MLVEMDTAVGPPVVANASLERQDTLLAGQARLLEMVASGAPLADILDELTRFIEAQEEGLRCGILIVTDDGRHFRRGSGPNLPEAYHRAFDGVPITPPYLGPCSQAAHQGAAVVVPDIATDCRWPEAWRDLVLACGLQGCRSTPVRAPNGTVLASFAMYYDRPRDPHPAHPQLPAPPQLIEIATHLTGIALERERSQAALRDSEKRLRAIFNATSIGAAILTPALRFVQVNDAFCAMSGYSREELRARDCAALTHPDDCARTQELTEALLAGRISNFVIDKRYVRKDGGLIWVQNSVSLVRDDAGEPRHLVALCQDITERRRAEALTECQKRALQMLAEGAALDDVLGFLVRTAEAHATGGMLGSVLLLDETGTHFARGIGPSLPPEFNAAVAGVAVDSMIGLCCHAVSRREPVVVADFDADPRWACFAEFVAPYGLRAGWSTPIFGAQGKVLGSFANYYRQPCDPTPRDLEWIEIVTHTAAIAIERARAETALRRAYQQAIDILESIDDAFFAVDREWRFTYVNRRTEELWAKSRDALLAHNVREIFPQATGTPIHAAMQRAMRERQTISCEEFSVITRRWLRCSFYPSRTGLSVYLRDVTKRRQAEEALRLNREHLTAALAASDTGTFRWNPRTGEFLEFDENLKRLFGFAPDEQVRMTEDFIARVHPDDLPALRSAMEACRQGGDFSMEYRVVLPEGGIRWLYDRARVERDDTGNPIYLIGACTDITRRKEIEEAYRELSETLEHQVTERTRALDSEMAERRKAEAALQRARHLEAIGQLTGGVAHDFNNLLTVVAGQAELINAAGADRRIRGHVAAIERAAERGARLIGQLLTFARRQNLYPEAVTIAALMANIDDLVRRAVGEAVQVAFRAEPDLWPSLIDPAQFESAILNLAINARDAMPQGGRLVITARNTTLVKVEAWRLDIAPGDYVVVNVADTGIGMPADVRDHAFEPFFTTKDVGKGTGLGLAQIYGFVRQSGGAVTLESAVGRGTTISLYLPRAAAAVEPAQSASAPAMPAEGPGQTILVVEDQPEVREVIEALLDQLGYRVLAAADGIAAQRLLENGESIDLLLTDILMPNGISGLDLAEQARRLRPDLKIVLVSGYSRDAQIRPDGPHAGFVFLEKPFRQAQLVEAITAAFGTGPG